MHIYPAHCACAMSATLQNRIADPENAAYPFVDASKQGWDAVMSPLTLLCCLHDRSVLVADLTEQASSYVVMIAKYSHSALFAHGSNISGDFGSIFGQNFPIFHAFLQRLRPTCSPCLATCVRLFLFPTAASLCASPKRNY